MHSKTILEERALVVQRDEHRAAWHSRWAEEDLDFVLTVPFPLPALENGTSEKASLMTAGYTFIFNVVRIWLNSDATRLTWKLFLSAGL